VEGPAGRRCRRRPRPAGRGRRRRRAPDGGRRPDRPPAELTAGGSGGRQAGRQVAGPPPSGIVQRYWPGGAPGGVGAVGAAGSEVGVGPVVGVGSGVAGMLPATGAVQVESPPPAGTWQCRVPGSLAKDTVGSGSPAGRHSAAPLSVTTQPRAGTGVTPSAAEQRIAVPVVGTHCKGTGRPVRSASWVKGSVARRTSMSPAPARVRR